jgi:hypothetical protein
MGQAPREVFETTVRVVPVAGSCVDRKETPASEPSMTYTSSRSPPVDSHDTRERRRRRDAVELAFEILHGGRP